MYNCNKTCDGESKLMLYLSVGSLSDFALFRWTLVVINKLYKLNFRYFIMYLAKSVAGLSGLVII